MPQGRTMGKLWVQEGIPTLQHTTDCVLPPPPPSTYRTSNNVVITLTEPLWGRAMDNGKVAGWGQARESDVNGLSGRKGEHGEHMVGDRLATSGRYSQANHL